jgi:DDB1- and CUL4-associated factor 7
MSASSATTKASTTATTKTSSPSSLASAQTSKRLKKEMYKYEAPWLVYAMNWSERPDKPYRLAIGSFLEDFTNRVSIIELDDTDDAQGSFKKKATFEHPYPPTKIMWVPDRLGRHEDLLATTGDYLRIWGVDEATGEVTRRAILNNNRLSEFCAPLTSFDWSRSDPATIGTSSIDTTCTIWDVTTQTARTQLIAHDKEVYDIAFSNDRNVFATVGADGSMRMFDLRQLEHSTIVYETGSGADTKPLLRLSWNKQDDNYLAAVAMDSNKAIVIDIRVPSLPAAELQGHQDVVNAVAWAPHSSLHLCTAGEDHRALIWDLSPLPKPVGDPILAYNARNHVNQLQWSTAQPDWIGITYANTVEILRV